MRRPAATVVLVPVASERRQGASETMAGGAAELHPSSWWLLWTSSAGDGRGRREKVPRGAGKTVASRSTRAPQPKAPYPPPLSRNASFRRWLSRTQVDGVQDFVRHQIVSNDPSGCQSPSIAIVQVDKSTAGRPPLWWRLPTFRRLWVCLHPKEGFRAWYLMGTICPAVGTICPVARPWMPRTSLSSGHWVYMMDSNTIKYDVKVISNTGGLVCCMVTTHAHLYALCSCEILSLVQKFA
ncbi:uncharacterized protein [Lolium perenne]|uniref:uncharacterized protein isoform X1 n=1 Tax=Lolium perenne TaxID=4522 RepID=UPI003A9A433A